MAKLKWLQEYCNKCGNQLGSWDARLSKALAYKYPCCESCISAEYEHERLQNYKKVVTGRQAKQIDYSENRGVR